ncbi:hypothetical protein SLS62_003489 [Diatrype stigma]|uniref:Uncharacterized protein n=1 Tax=Diatrype stigma TaxID=117547 RepID=A0AAN9V4S1_9PEZI
MTSTGNPRVLAHLCRVMGLEPVPGDDKVSIATVMGFPCAVMKTTASVGDLAIFMAVDTFIPKPENDKAAFLFDKEINPFHAAESKMAMNPATPRDLTDGIRIKPTLVAGKLSSGLALTFSSHPSLLEVLKALDEANSGRTGSAEASNALSSLLKLHHWRQTVAFETVWDRPEFIPNPSVRDIKEMKLDRAQAQHPYHVTTQPPDASEMIVYFLRKDSKLAQSIEHRQTNDRDIDGKRQKKVATVGRVGVCNAQFDYHEMFSNPSWATVLKAELPEKLADFNKNVALEGFYTTFKVKGMTTRAFTVTGIWNLDTQTRWPWADTMRKAKEWGLRYVFVHYQTTTLRSIAVGEAKKRFQKDNALLVFRSVDGKAVFSQK